MNLLPQLICAHLIGDFILQNNWMACYKHLSSPVCLVHVLVYMLPFWLLLPQGLPVLALLLILIEHFLQDRFTLARKWMKFYRQTPIEHWPTGPLCVDQAMHIGFIWIVCLFI